MPKPIRIVIYRDPKFYRGKPVAYEKCGVLYLRDDNPISGASNALDQYKILIGNRIWRIEWYYCRRLRRKCPDIAFETCRIGVQRLARGAIPTSAELLTTKFLASEMIWPACFFSVSFFCVSSETHLLQLRAWDRQTDGQTDGQMAVSLNAPDCGDRDT